MNEEIKYVTVKEVAEYMHVARSTAYKIIRMLNDELKENGYITISGRVPKDYFTQRVYKA